MDLSLLDAVDAAFAGTTDVAFAVQRVTRVVSETFGDPVAVRLDDGSGALLIAAVHGPDRAVADDILRTGRRTPLPASAMAVLRQGRRSPFVLDRAAVDETVAMRGLGHRRQYHVGVVAPICLGDTVVGTLALACTNEAHDHRADDTLSILDVVARRCAEAVNRARIGATLDASLAAPRMLAEGPHAALLSQTSDIVLVVSGEGRITDVSPAITSVLGRSIDEILHQSLFDLVDLEDRQHVAEQLRLAMSTPGPMAILEFRTAHQDGTIRWLEVRGNNLVDDPSIGALVITARDVTERHQAAELVAAENAVLQQLVAEEPLARVFESLCTMIERRVGAVASSMWLLEPDGKHALVAAPTLPGAVTSGPGQWRVDPEEISFGVARDGVFVLDPVQYMAWSKWRALATRFGIAGLWLRVITDHDEQPLGLVTVHLAELRDPTEHERQVFELATGLAGMSILRDRATRDIAHAARHDSLTGLPNRATLLAHLKRVLQRLEGEEPIAVLFVDLDDFKLVNDSAGHAVGDRLLQQVGERLAELIRPTDLIARLGGDEFAVLCHGLGLDGANHVAGRVLDALARPFEVDGQRFDVSASVGITVGHAGATAGEVLRDADAAMYAAKRAGRSRSAVFTPAVREAGLHRLRIEQGLRRALEDDVLDVHYQPVVALASGRLLALEALVRWPGAPHPVPEFIEIAEASALIRLLGETVLRTAVARVGSWRASGLIGPDVRMAVNVSARQLADPAFVQLVVAVLAEHDVPGAALCLEVTESVVMSDLDGVTAVMNELQRVGVTFAIDDFGTGHSSLARLRSLAASVLKLDRSFIVDIDDDEESVQIVANVIGLAHALGKQVVIEGVERPAQLKILRRLGADAAQGFELARPAPVDVIEDYLRTRPGA